MGDTAFDRQSEVPPPQPSQVPPDAGYSNAPPATSPVSVVNAPQEQNPAEVDYPVPVYTGIIVVNPPNYKAPSSKNPAKPVAPATGTSGDPSKPVIHPPVKPKPPDPDRTIK